MLLSMFNCLRLVRSLFSAGKLERAASRFRDGEVASIEMIAKAAGEDLAYTAVIQR